MMQVKFTPRCQALLDRSRLSEDLAVTAVNARQLTIADGNSTRLVASRWFPNNLLVLVDGEVSGGGKGELTAEVVLALRPRLPAGAIDGEADAETVLAVAAESFGYPLTCDGDEPLSTLYSGFGNRRTVVVHSGCIPREYWLIGSFDDEDSQAELVWAFRPDRYLAWWHSVE
jgi:hypothetical protein